MPSSRHCISPITISFSFHSLFIIYSQSNASIKEWDLCVPVLKLTGARMHRGKSFFIGFFVTIILTIVAISLNLVPINFRW